MNNKTVFKVAFISVLVFIIVGTYFWYLYFKNGEGELISKNVRLELVNNGNINYINASPLDPAERIPTYYFRIKNNSNSSIKYEVYLNDVKAVDANDGCNDATNYKRNELKYELKLDNKVIKTGLLTELLNNVLDENTILGNTTNNYSLRIWLSDGIDNAIYRHYHYVINLKEKE